MDEDGEGPVADTEEALREYAEIEGKAEEELDPDDKLMQEKKCIDMA